MGPRYHTLLGRCGPFYAYEFPGTEVARRLPSVRGRVPEAVFNAFEDFTVMMNTVQERG